MSDDGDDRERGRGGAELGRELLDQASRRAQRATSVLGQGVERAASFVEAEVGPLVERGSVPGVGPEQVTAVAGELRGAADYLQSVPPGQILSDLDAAVRRHPYRAVAIGLGLGWIVGRLTRRS